MKRTGHAIIALALVCSLSLAAVARYLADRLRNPASDNSSLPQVQPSEANPTRARGLANMDSYALGLLLGGLRGPLVMFLWTTSENEKTAHNLDDFNTKVEWIRLLQPEFDSVHLFQIWNKAYNISVQMTNLSNKYTTILDALDYAQSVNRQRPDDINILFDMGHVYGQKLGESHEAPYYIARVRRESKAPIPLTRVTLPHAELGAFMASARLAGMDQPSSDISTDDQTDISTMLIPTAVADAMHASSESGVTFKPVARARPRTLEGVTRDQMDPVLDASGNILPALLAPTHPRPAGMSPDAYWYDGSELQFLKKYEPFPYGVAPQGFAYNYYKRAEMLELVAHESELQTSDFVVDSRPALELEFWAAQEGLEGRRAELRLFGIDDSGDKIDIENRAPAADPAHPPHPAAWENRPDAAAGPRALEQYARASRLNRDSFTELEAHFTRFPGKHDTLMSHLEDAQGFEHLFAGDHDFLAGILDPADRGEKWKSAAAEYQQSLVTLDLNILRHNVEDGLMKITYPTDPATGQPHTRLTIDQASPAQRHAVVVAIAAKSDTYYKTNPNEMAGDRNDMMKYVIRCEARLAAIGAPLLAGGGR